MIRLALPIAALAIAACDPVPAPETPPVPPAAGSCSADGLGSLIGKQRSDAVEAEAMRLSGARTVRWLAPDSVMTMDYRIDRLNALTDDKGVLTGFRCG